MDKIKVKVYILTIITLIKEEVILLGKVNTIVRDIKSKLSKDTNKLLGKVKSKRVSSRTIYRLYINDLTLSYNLRLRVLEEVICKGTE